MAEPEPTHEDGVTSPSGRFAVVLLVAVACAGVTIAAGGTRLVGPPLDLGGGSAWMVRILGMLLVAGGVTALLAQRKRLAPETTGGADPSRFALTTAASLMAAVALMAVIAHPLVRRPPPGGVPYVERPITVPRTGTGPAPPPPPQFGLGLGRAGEDQLSDPDSPSLARLEGISNDVRERVAQIARWALLFALGLAGALFVARKMRWLGKDRSAPSVTPQEAEEGLEFSLKAFDVAGGDGPREQITAAYRRLLVVLERADFPREPYEAPHEHLDRVLGPLGVPSGPLHELAGLYVRAHFGEEPVDERHRDSAIRALEASLTHLRVFAATGRPSPLPGDSNPRVPTEASK
jgi:hypothetical protein